MFNLMTDFLVMVILAHGHIRLIALGPSVRFKSVLLCRYDFLHSRQAIGSSENYFRLPQTFPRPTQDPQNLSVPDLAPAKHKFQNGRQEDRSSA